MKTNTTKLLAWSGFMSTLLIGTMAVAQGPSGAKKRFDPPPTTSPQPTSPQSRYPATQYPQPVSPVQQPAPVTYPVEQPAPAYESAYEPAESQTNSSASVDPSTGNFWGNRHLGVSARVGTLGLGVELTTQLIQDRLNFRAGFNSFSYNYEAEADDDDGNNNDGDLEYDGDLKLRSLPLLIDYHPFKGGFRATAGLVVNSSEITANARCNDATCEFGDESFDRETIGTTSLKVDLGGTQPYLGIGWGNAVHSIGRWAFAFDLGVVFQDVEVSITPSDSCRADARCNAEVESERAELQEDADDIDMYPVLSFGLSYKFL